MSENNESTKLAIHASSYNSSFMASAKVGNGLGRSIANNLGELQVHNSGG
jgi:hypothetical protein